jgi:hypothetical protein
MTPAQLRALLGAVLIPNVPGVSVATARYRVLGFSGDTVRVSSGNDARSVLSIHDLETALLLGNLRVEVVDGPLRKST